MKTLMNRNCPYYMDCTLAKSMMYKALIHFVGDVHQPLHCVNRYSKDYRNGDAGGNRFKLNFGYYKNLHALWDAVVTLDGGTTTVRLGRP